MYRSRQVNQISGALTKGPIAVLLLVPPLWLQRRLAGTNFCLRWRDLIAYGSAIVAVMMPWYVAVCLRSPEFARS